ncbi:hypothetical protein PMAG_a1396 [Pseudoalteromonas mariniglutinosa NCIMB 1770]|nr:hypothetical protein [Pseudoalteromonas mariniglutinosa NCIMB 1770]
MINHDLQLPWCLPVGSALAEKALRFGLPVALIKVLKCLLISSNKKAVLDLTNTAFIIFSL